MEPFKRSVRRFFKSIRRFFRKVAKGDKQSIAILAAACAAVVLVIVVCALLTGRHSEPESSSAVSVSSGSYNKDAASIAVEEYDGVILQESEDRKSVV